MFNHKLKQQVSAQQELIDTQQAVLAAIKRSMAVIEFMPDGTIIDANENFLATVGYQRADIVGKHHRIFCEKGYTFSAEYAEF
ncbi:PAS domain-containing protein [Crenobacter cavernae]|uniref:PAS domain-containing protein n=1 Tax=Crenobacter cavernae TaxID=2290923 RepID=UPI00269E60DA